MPPLIVAVFAQVLSIVRSHEVSRHESLCLIQTQTQLSESSQSISLSESKNLTKGSSLIDRSSASQADSHVDHSASVQVARNGNSSQVHLIDAPMKFLDHIQDMGWKEFGVEYWYSLKYLVLVWLTYVIMAFLLYLCCFRYPPERLPFEDIEDPLETMSRHHFGCFRTPCICCCSFFCPILQWADNMKLAHILEILPAICMFAACGLFNSLTLTGIMIDGAFTALLIIYYRQKIRERFGLKSWTVENCLIDFLYVCCCPCCAVAQEAQAVRFSSEGFVDGGAPRQPRFPAYASQFRPPYRVDSRIPDRQYFTGQPTSPVVSGTYTSSPAIYTTPVSASSIIMPPTSVLQSPSTSLPSSGTQITPPSYGNGSQVRYTR
mmetsp:Transcript_25973/g.41769  ORF Transcript_25973/g.41769 Transcript_25973/m.41769 type:complete len:377 (-) Transcript_25973:122-1252(-)